MQTKDIQLQVDEQQHILLIPRDQTSCKSLTRYNGLDLTENVTSTWLLFIISLF
jgi:hypothetical protein